MKAFPVPDEIANDPAAIKKWHADHHWFPNQLRHTAGTEIRKQYGLEAAQTVLGHSKADVTEVYAERDYALAARVAKEVG
jgi:site-specific recombinase XerC